MRKSVNKLNEDKTENTDYVSFLNNPVLSEAYIILKKDIFPNAKDC